MHKHLPMNDSQVSTPSSLEAMRAPHFSQVGSRLSVQSAAGKTLLRLRPFLIDAELSKEGGK